QLNRLHDFLPEIITLLLWPLKWGRRNWNSYSLRPNLHGYSYNSIDTSFHPQIQSSSNLLQNGEEKAAVGSLFLPPNNDYHFH
ncbi:hypothetical protein LC653_45695, partial [Nostoc sp. CHAB 5784]|uniref:hypothetical protein n=1 Tax=Nostoc mirabile TaxID=2907820 RepID=UPI001E2AFF57